MAHNSSTNVIEFRDVGFQFPGAPPLLAHLTLTIQRGECLMLLGRSGSGKTTSLKLINRLLTPTTGEVRIEDTPAQQWDVIRLRRRIGYTIQEVGLFPHLTVAQNIALVPRLEKWDKARIQTRIHEVLNLVGLQRGEFAGRHPGQLSGGQKQRVGLARALATDPGILLMDEPFGALDPITRAELQHEFKELRGRLGKTVAFVTHDLGEALLLGDRIALLDSGTLCGIYTPREFLDSSDAAVQGYVQAFRAGQYFG